MHNRLTLAMNQVYNSAIQSDHLRPHLNQNQAITGSALERFYKHTLNQFKKKFINDHSKVMLVLWFIFNCNCSSTFCLTFCSFCWGMSGGHLLGESSVQPLGYWGYLLHGTGSTGLHGTSSKSNPDLTVIIIHVQNMKLHRISLIFKSFLLRKKLQTGIIAIKINFQTYLIYYRVETLISTLAAINCEPQLLHDSFMKHCHKTLTKEMKVLKKKQTNKTLYLWRVVKKTELILKRTVPHIFPYITLACINPERRQKNIKKTV